MKKYPLLLLFPLMLGGCCWDDDNLTCEVHFAKSFNKETREISDYYTKNEETNMYTFNANEDIFVELDISAKNPDTDPSIVLRLEVFVAWADCYEKFDFESGYVVPTNPVKTPILEQSETGEMKTVGYNSVLSNMSFVVKKEQTMKPPFLFIMKSAENTDENKILDFNVSIVQKGSPTSSKVKDLTLTEKYTFVKGGK